MNISLKRQEWLRLRLTHVVQSFYFQETILIQLRNWIYNNDEINF